LSLAGVRDVGFLPSCGDPGELDEHRRLSKNHALSTSFLQICLGGQMLKMIHSSHHSIPSASAGLGTNGVKDFLSMYWQGKEVARIRIH